MILKTTLEVRNESALVPIIRRIAVHPLRELGVIEDDVDRAAAVISEACSNVCKYAYEGRDDYRVDLEYHAEMFTIDVTDHGRGFDSGSVNPPKPGQIGGYGLSLIREYADSSEIESGENGGTTVHAEMSLVYRNDEYRERAHRLDGE
jgi:anti-sigma regulatory factor (Ser/Thr protein kinase)